MTSSPEPADATLIYLARHGATDNNLAHPPRLQGQRSDPPLSAAGREQAQALARFLGDQGITACYASPMVRARETAQALADRLQLAVGSVPDLRECDIGRWEGRDWAEIERTEPEPFRLFHEDAGVHPYAEGENLTQLRDRVAPALEGLAAAHPGGRILVVAHNVVNRCYLAHVLKLPLRYTRQIPQHNTGLNVIRWQQGRAQVLAINSVWHLGDGA
jgi:broad specificity phosphatase PhoE